MDTVAFILILFAHVDPMGDGNSNALTTAKFASKIACENAGKMTKTMVKATTKSIEFVCVPENM